MDPVWKRNIKCKTCDTVLLATNRWRHERTQKHLMIKHIKDQIKELVKNKSN